MADRMRSIPRRGIAVVALFALLGGLCVQYGTLAPDPSANRYPGSDGIAAGTVAPGDRVVVAGIVRSVGAEGVVVDAADGHRIVVGFEEGRTLGTDPDPDVGEGVWIYGVLRPDGAVSVERAIVRPMWEMYYLYAASFLGGLLVFVRFLRTWRLDTDRWQFVPREESRG